MLWVWLEVCEEGPRPKKKETHRRRLRSLITHSPSFTITQDTGTISKEAKQPAMPPPRVPILALALLLAALPKATPSQMVTYKLQHAFGLTAAFQDRGTIEVLVDSGALTLIPPPEDQPVLVPEGSFDEIAREMRLPDGGLYRLRAQRTGASAPVIMTSVRLCDVVRAGFRENITLMLDVEGRLLGLEYTPRMSVLSPTTCLAMKSPLDQVHRDTDGKKKEATADTKPAAFSTFIKAAVDQAGQSPPVVVPGQRPPMIQIRYDEQERQPQVEKSFIQKYVRTQRREGEKNAKEIRCDKGGGGLEIEMGTYSYTNTFLTSLLIRFYSLFFLPQSQQQKPHSGSLSSWPSYFSTRVPRRPKKKAQQEEEREGKEHHHYEGRAPRGEEEEGEEGQNGSKPKKQKKKKRDRKHLVMEQENMGCRLVTLCFLVISLYRGFLPLLSVCVNKMPASVSTLICYLF